MSTITVNIDGHETNGHFLRSHYEEVAEIMVGIGRLESKDDLMGILEAPSHVKGVPENSGITPDLSKPIRDLIQKCQLPFELDENVEACFGGGKGSANTTTTFERTGMSLEEAFEIFHISGQFDDALAIIEKLRAETDPEAEVILAYAMATLSKGWRAEKFLNATERWKTGSISQDQGGLDLWDAELEDWIQLKPLTVIASNGHNKFKNKKQKHLFYFWNGDGQLEVTDADNWKEPKNRASKETGIPGTLLIKSERLKSVELDRPARFLWW